eukprot:CAMPEP_0176116014 /NCGR_PEP_ID=MMETSP0120_2-20121206/58263_1 /TAXON_ID=160619 /ORGANISM="Kryptoperidinium foliaceum, Strain CCMP 1326" /LENGTH=188 /DNA_ID=CAMNT_0017450259 /DNA_START=25 /DNA_END=591 /DNA_ORIENTATION=+
MAAMVASVRFDAETSSYVARYLSASEARAEVIPHDMGHRLRFCPPSARRLLRLPRSPLPPPAAASHIGAPCCAHLPLAYPHRVLEGFVGLCVGEGVELQWKRQPNSPFGWWWATLEEFHEEDHGETATAVLVFGHFPPASRWYRLAVRFGDGRQRPCALGGFTGGLRSATDEEARQWMRFFPKEPIVF